MFPASSPSCHYDVGGRGRGRGEVGGGRGEVGEVYYILDNNDADRRSFWVPLGHFLKTKGKATGHRQPPEIRCDTHHYGVGSVGAKICITSVSLFFSQVRSL
jgi:hypothetical protein